MHFSDAVAPTSVRLDRPSFLRSSLLKSAGLALVLTTGLVAPAFAAGGAGGANPGSGVGGNGGTASGGAGGNDGMGNTGGAGGTAYKGVGSPFGTGGGGGGTGTAVAPQPPGTFTGGTGGGLGNAGTNGSSGDPGGSAGANGNGAGAATLTNTAPLAGAAGGASAGGLAVVGQGGGGSGGIGAFVTGGGASSNTSTIVGGAGGNSDISLAGVGTGGGGAGGIGALFFAPGTSFNNSGAVTGGAGGSSGSSLAIVGGGGGGAGGTGILFATGGASLRNSGAIAGGAGGNSGGSLDSRGAGGGGEGGIGALFVGDGARFTNTSTGTVTGGAGGTSGSSLAIVGDGGGGAGGAAVSVLGNNARLTNDGVVTGGAGGGTGASLSIVGQGGGGEGGAGINIAGDNARLTNNGTVTGGAGGSNGPSLVIVGAGSGGSGGAGVSVTGGQARVVNNGAVTGGVGGTVGATLAVVTPGSSGTGGAGMFFSGPAAYLFNTGTVTGGNGGGPGGAGVSASGIVINNSGAISGGLAGDGVTQAFAIVLNGGRNAVGGSGAINGGIDVGGTSTFLPAVPGSPVGAQPLTITGPLVFAQTSAYNIRIAPAGNDRTFVNGTATLGGAGVNVLGKRFAVYRAGTRTILTATTRNGTFGAAATNLRFLNPTLSYDANNVFLTINGGGTFVIQGLTWNQRAVAMGLTNVARQYPTGIGGQIIAALNKVQPRQAPAVLDALSGEGITASQNIAFRSAQLFNSAIFDQTTFYSGGGAPNSITLGAPQPGFTALATPEQTLAAANSGQRVRELADLPNRKAEPVMPVALQRTWRAWGSGFGGVENIQGNAFPIGSANQNNSIIGGAIGVDYQLLPNYLLGVAVGGTDGNFRVPGRATSGSTSGGHVAFYDIATFGKFYGASSTSFSYFGNRTTRITGGFGGLATETQRGDFNSHEFRSRLEFGRHLDGPGLGALGVLTPFVALELAQLRSNGFNERAIAGPGLLGLNVQGQSIASVPSFVGFRLQRVTPLGNGMIFSPTLQVAWVHEFAPFRNQTAQIAALPGSVFLVDGARPARDAAQVKAGGELTIGPRTTVFANFDSEFSGVNQLYAGKGGLRYIW